MDNLYAQLYSYENLELAYDRVRKHKTTKPYVMEFESEFKDNLLKLQYELKTETYVPKPLETFILRDPKTRKISKSDFRDRIIHHAICNIIEPIFDKTFIYDSYANRLRKGTLGAIKRFDYFKRKVSKNNTKNSYFLKADIKHYFDTVDHKILLSTIKKRIKNKNLLLLIEKILQNHKTAKKGKGMPLGNLTSQLFANIYLNKLDQYVKHILKIKYYIRYVDDFIILENSINKLQYYKQQIDTFLKEILLLELHPDKSKILQLENGANFLGFRIFYNHKLIRKKNLKKFERNFKQLKKDYDLEIVDREKVIERFEGWIEYTRHADTYKYRRHLTRQLNNLFPIIPPIKDTKIKKHENNIKKAESVNVEFSQQKTKQLFFKGKTIKQIAEQRELKESTIYEHLTKLILYNQLNVWNILPKEKISKIQQHINSENDILKNIKQKISDNSISYNEINLVLAQVKTRNKKKNILFHCNWYQKNHCQRKCHLNPQQRETCKKKFNQFISQNPLLEMKKNEFLELFNNHMLICTLPIKQKLKYISWQEIKENSQYLKN
ncbi:MAG: helix-turn-helix domain-containing protein [Nanoarchaeota archaeon]|nr:helix-turn-helix domain-containing protein [Nanoarchaeota archaeon]MBU1270283.1 helix-turn-helix domain-containing protein [Nanoarchaeota archaeon]MBU1605176.1 helix-turn-helix domain-containing protein [Nanoarchaeota archaeon]MBU2442534.1 helix-turn-helix domain-containing protein [Nanoarchaeota archaeon]